MAPKPAQTELEQCAKATPRRWRAVSARGRIGSRGSNHRRRWFVGGSTKIRGVKRRDRLPSEGRASVRGRRLDVQPSMSATLTPRILVLPRSDDLPEAGEYGERLRVRQTLPPSRSSTSSGVCEDRSPGWWRAFGRAPGGVAEAGARNRNAGAAPARACGPSS